MARVIPSSSACTFVTPSTGGEGDDATVARAATAIVRSASRARTASERSGGRRHTQSAAAIANGMTAESVGSNGEPGPDPPTSASPRNIALWTGSNVLKAA